MPGAFSDYPPIAQVVKLFCDTKTLFSRAAAMFDSDFDTPATTPGKIEQDTGLTFFTALPTNVAAALRLKQDGLAACFSREAPVAGLTSADKPPQVALGKPRRPGFARCGFHLPGV